MKEIKRIYQALGNFLKVPYHEGRGSTFDFNLGQFCTHYKFNIMQAYHALKLVEGEGYIELIDEFDQQSKVRMLASRDDLYKFQIANAQFDPFIKLLLRTYSGMFNDFISIDERTLARNASTEIKVIFNYLNKLNNLKILRYIPRKNNPIIVFTTERMDEKSLFISAAGFREKKERYVSRLESVFEYVSANSLCRSQMLLRYFGDKDPPLCGTCDFCSRKTELDITKYEFDMLVEKIREVIGAGNVLLGQLMDSKDFKEERTLKVIRWLMDNNRIVVRKDNSLAWNS
jgi:ATP-dependent DNA helicase RecQ